MEENKNVVYPDEVQTENGVVSLPKEHPKDEHEKPKKHFRHLRGAVKWLSDKVTELREHPVVLGVGAAIGTGLAVGGMVLAKAVLGVDAPMGDDLPMLDETEPLMDTDDIVPEINEISGEPIVTEEE